MRLGNKPPSIDHLEVSSAQLESVRGITQWNGIAALEIDAAYRLPDLSELRDLESLEDLRLAFQRGQILNLEPLTELTRLRILTIERSEGLVIDLAPLANHRDLTVVVPENATLLRPESTDEGLGLTIRREKKSTAPSGE
jgi:hypothetical protein